MAAAAEPIARIPDEILHEILLQIPSSVSLVRAALVSKHWGGIISKTDFLKHYRKLHPSSPLLGIFSSNRPFGLPPFSLMDSVRSDTDLNAVERKGDFLLAGLKQDPTWRIRDSRNGHLLLCRAGESGDAFSIYNPTSRQLVTIPDRPHDRVCYFADCLLSDSTESFRVVSVQQHQRKIRAVCYDHRKLQWHFGEWESPWKSDRPNKLRSWGLEPMYAAGLIFWAYGAALALVLDCSSMKFSVCPIPVCTWYAIGEIEDGVGCLVSLEDLPNNPTSHGALKVWLLNTGGGTITWELSGDQITVRELLGREARVHQVVLVTNGLALLSWDHRYDQFVIDLKNRSLHEEINFHGRAYPYQMPWPPLALTAVRFFCQEVVDDVDVAPPVDDVGLAAPLDDVDLAAQIDDVADTEGSSGAVLRPHDVCGIEHVMAPEAAYLVGTVKDGVRLMETKAADTAAPSADLVEGMPESSEAISRKPRCEEAVDDVDVAPRVDDVGLAAPLDDVDLAAGIDDVADTEGPSGVVLRPHDLCATDHVMAPEAAYLVGTVKDGVRLMETNAADTAAPSADLVEGMPELSEAIPRKPRCEEEVELECQPEILPLLQMTTAQKVNLDALVNPAADRTNAMANSEVLRSHDPCTVEQSMASKAKNLVATADHMEQIMPATYASIDAESGATPYRKKGNMSPEGKTKERQDFALDAHPSEEKLIESYLKPRVLSDDKSCRFIHEGDVNAAHPADLTREYQAAVSSNGDQVWYFFTTVHAKGSRKARTVESGKGFWHSEGRPKAVQQLGYRRYLKFATNKQEGHGRVKSSWTMVELSLHQDGRDKVNLCKVYFSRHATKNRKTPVCRNDTGGDAAAVPAK